MKKHLPFFLGIAVLIFGVLACQTYFFRANYKEVNGLLHESDSLKIKPFLKAHLKNGDVCILQDSWGVDTVADVLSGKGTRYDFNRKIVSKGMLSIPIDSIAIFETNQKLKKTEAGRATALGIMAGLDVILGIICLSNPKSCFGSCPTFYLNENDNFHYADAEGFSNAIAPSLEYADVDALPHKAREGNKVSITMKNEAQETHCVKSLQLLACPVKPGERVYHAPNDRFYRCEGRYPLSKATAEEGDVTHLLQADDRQERFSYADENNLSSKEEIYLSFDNVVNTNELGLNLHFRQTMMTTYFIYSAMGYMGDEVSDIFAKIETNRSTAQKLEGGIKTELGDIMVYAWNEQNGAWDFQGQWYETGPIAINRQMLPLKTRAGANEVRIKLVLNKGLWRIDYAALTGIKEEVTPTAIKPSAALNKGENDPQALFDLNSPERYLISMPGSAYKFSFELPEANADYDLFLYSKGYYLEWMRAHWIKDKNLLKLKQMFDDPKQFLKEEAKSYKPYETQIEQEFWGSKIDPQSFMYYEK